MAVCEVCGRECPDEDAYCGACGHRLGREPQEPIRVQLCDAEPQHSGGGGGGGGGGGCCSCLTSAVGAVVLVVFAAWLFGC